MATQSGNILDFLFNFGYNLYNWTKGKNLKKSQDKTNITVIYRKLYREHVRTVCGRFQVLLGLEESGRWKKGRLEISNTNRGI